MKTTLLSIFSILLICMQLAAQNRIDIDWQKTPKKIQADVEKWSPFGALFLYNYVKSKYDIQHNDIKHTKTIHRRIRLFNEEAVAAFNTLKIPYTDEYKISEFRARTVHPDGTVNDVKKENIEYATEEGVQLMLIAFENLDIGDDIEFYYEWNFPPAEFQTIEMNTGLSTLVSYFEVELDQGIEIDLVGYNGVEVYTDTQAKGTILYSEVKNLVEDEEEQFSFPMSQSPRIEFSIASPKSKFKNKARTWDDYNPVFNRPSYMQALTDRSLHKLLRQIPLDGNEEDQIFAIEDYLKSHYTIAESGNQPRDIKTLMKASEWTSEEYASVMAALYTTQEIDFRIGYTTNRSTKAFDPTFVSRNNMEFMFFFFPKYKRYLLPESIALRYGYMPSVLRGNQSVLYDVKPESKHTIHTIPFLRSDDNYHNHKVKIEILAESEKIKVQTEQSMMGDTKANNLPYIMLLEGFTKDDFVKNLFIYDEDGDEVEDFEIQNDKWQAMYNEKPLVIESEVTSQSLLQKVADDEYLVNVGAVIGRQAELPQKSHERIYEIELGAPHSLMRQIVFKLPEGFRAVNMSDLEIDKSLEINGERICYFLSHAKMQGDEIIIDISESYETPSIDRAYYEKFRDVINAAAEFNKLDLLLTKNY